VIKPHIALYMIFWYTDWSSSIQQLFEFFNYALWANKIFSCTYKQEEIAKCYKNKVCMWHQNEQLDTFFSMTWCQRW